MDGLISLPFNLLNTEPNLRIQHVKYSSNGYDGYVADVTYEGTAVYPEAKPYAPAPAYHKPAYAPAPAYHA